MAVGGGVGAPVSSSRLLPTGPPEPLVIAVHGPAAHPAARERAERDRDRLPRRGRGRAPARPGGASGERERLLAVLPPDLRRQRRGHLLLPARRRRRAVDGLADVGAAPGTDVYAPVDGTVVGLRDYVLDGRAYGSIIDIQPTGQPSVVVSVTHLRPDPSLTVGSMLTSGTSKIGAVLDFSGVEKLALARYTRDAGNQVEIEVHPAASLPLR